MNRPIRIGFLGLVLLLVLLRVFGQRTPPDAAPVAADTVVGEIEGRPITFAAFAATLLHDPLYAGAGENGNARVTQDLADPRQLERRLDEYLTTEVLYREAVRTGFPDEPGAAADLAVTLRNFTIESFKLQLEAEVRKQAAPTPADLAALRTAYLVDQIGIPFENPEQEERMREVASVVRTMLQAGSAEVGRGIDAYFKQLLESGQIGYLAEKTSGWLTAPDLSAPIAAEIESFKDGETRVVRSDGRYTVVRLLERKQLSEREVTGSQVLRDRAASAQINTLLQQQYQRLFEKHGPAITLHMENLYDESKVDEVLIEVADFYRISVRGFLEQVNGMGVPTIGAIGSLYFVDSTNRANAERFIQIYFISPLVYYLEGKEQQVDQQPAFQAAYEYRRRAAIARLYLQRQRDVLHQESAMAEERIAAWQRDLRRQYGAKVRFR